LSSKKGRKKVEVVNEKKRTVLRGGTRSRFTEKKGQFLPRQKVQAIN